MNRELKRALGPVKGRIRLLRALDALFWGALIGAAGSFLLMCLSFLIPMEERPWLIGGFIAASLVLPSLAALLWPVRPSLAARRADACALDERVQSAMEFSGESPMEKLLLGDALARLQGLAVKKAMPLPVPRKRLMIACGIFILSAALLFIPNPQDAVIEDRQAFRAEMEEAAKRVEEAAVEAQEKEYSEAEKAALRKLMGDLAEGLRKSQDEREALTEIAKAEQSAQELLRKEALNALSNALSENGMDALSAQAAQAAAGAESAEALAQALEAASAEAADANLQEALQNAAQAIQSADISALAAAASSLSGESSSLSSGNLSNLLQSLREGISGAGGSAGQLGAQGGSSGNGQGEGSGSGSGSGNGGGSGTGAGQGSGSGAGQGSTNQEASGGSESSSGQSGQNGAQYMEGQYETIYDPTRLGGDGEASQVSGLDEDAEHVQIEMGPGAGDTAGTVPYREVIEEYSEAAARDAGDPSLPVYVKEWVDGYFNALTE